MPLISPLLNGYDLVLVAPANESGRLWASLADIRLLCWDRATKPAEVIDRVRASFEKAGVPMTGLIGFGLPEEGMALGGQGAEPGVETTAATGFFEDQDEEYLEDDTDQRLEAGDLRDVDYSDDDLVAGDEDRMDREGVAIGSGIRETGGSAAMGEEPEGGSSRVFWWTALVSLALIVTVSVYYLKFVRVGDSGPTDQPPTVAARVDLAPRDLVSPTEQAEDRPDSELPAESQDLAGENVGAGSAAEAEAAVTKPAGDAGADPTLTEGDQAAEAEVAQDPPPAPQPNLKPAAESASSGLSFAMDPYLPPVGQDGWALHLFSVASVRTNSI